MPTDADPLQPDAEKLSMAEQALLDVMWPMLPDSGGDWRSIATAPRNGGDALNLLVALPGGRIRIAWWQAKDGHWVALGGFRIYPTHWMPLPSPPEEKS